MRVGVLGGSYDPIHHGHLLAAVALRETLGLDEVLLVPAGSQPFKAGQHLATADDRAAMVGLAVAGVAGLRLDRREVDRSGPSYTVDTLRGLASERPEAHLVLLIGSDAAVEFPSWKEAEMIRTLAEVVVFARSGGSTGAVVGQPVVSVPLVELSATSVRERVAQGLSIRFMVPEQVEEYIATHRLYRGNEG